MESVYFLSIISMYFKCREESDPLNRSSTFSSQTVLFLPMPQARNLFLILPDLHCLSCLPCSPESTQAMWKKAVHLVIVHITVIAAWETQLDQQSLQSMCSLPVSGTYLLIALPSHSERPTILSVAKAASKCKNCFISTFSHLRKKGDSWHIQEHLTYCQYFCPCDFLTCEPTQH